MVFAVALGIVAFHSGMHVRTAVRIVNKMPSSIIDVMFTCVTIIIYNYNIIIVNKIAII